MRSPSCALFLTVVLVFAASAAWSGTLPQKDTAETAAQFYLRWRATALKATSMGEITPFWTAETIDEFSMEPAPAKAGALAMVKRVVSMQSDVKVITETPTPNGATLSVEGLDRDRKPVVCSVNIVKENGAWKISNAVEQWKPRPTGGDRRPGAHGIS